MRSNNAGAKPANSCTYTSTVNQREVIMEAASNLNDSSADAVQAFFSDVFEPSTLEKFNANTLAQIPILEYMGISFSEFKCGAMRTDMPLGPNINDKNTGFGGSIVTMATITGWALLSILLNKDERKYDVVIVESNTQYQAPVTEDCYGIARLNEGQILKLLRDLVISGRARTHIDVGIHVNEQKVATFSGQYYVRPVKQGV